MTPAPARRVRLRFLGSGDAFGSGGRLQTCLLLDGAAAPVLVDCGASSLIALKGTGVDCNAIGTAIITHLHGDHFGGLPFLILDGQFSRRTAPLVVAGPPGIAARVEAAMEVFFPGSSAVPRKFPVEFVELEERRPVDVGPAGVTAFRVEHACGAPPYAVRVTYGGRTIAYSGDTEWSDALLDAARDADLFVCEAYFFAKRIRYHLDFATLRAQRDRLACRRLILTHLGADMLEHLAEVDAEFASDGLVVEL